MTKRTGLKNTINVMCSHTPPVLLLFLLTLTACGRPLGTVEVQGNPTLTVSIDTASLDKFFRPYCAQLLIAQGDSSPSPSDVSACSTAMVSNFLAEAQGLPTLPVPSPSPSI